MIMKKLAFFLSDLSLQLMLTTEQIAVLCYILGSSQSSQIQTAILPFQSTYFIKSYREILHHYGYSWLNEQQFIYLLKLSFPTHPTSPLLSSLKKEWKQWQLHKFFYRFSHAYKYTYAYTV